MSSSLPFERTQTPLVVKYECGLRERLYQLVQTYSGFMKLSVKPNPSTFRVKSNGQGQGSLLISYEAPAELSTQIMQLCGVSESSSSVVRILILFFHVSCKFHSDLIKIVNRAPFFCRFQNRCAASEERDIHFFRLGTASDETGEFDARSFVSESSARGEARRVAELSERLVEQAVATAAAERGRADAERARAEFAERMAEQLATVLRVQGSQMNLLPRQ